MVSRFFTRRYATLSEVLRDWSGTMRDGALMIPADQAAEEPAPNVRIDLVLPQGFGRIGPIDGQLIQRMKDGAVAFRVAEFPPAMTEAMGRIDAVAADLGAWLVESGALTAGAGEEVARLKARVRELEQLLAAKPRTAAVAPAAGPQGQLPPAERPRGLLVPDVADVPPAIQGRLGDRSLRDAWMEVALQRLTGLLTMEYPDGRVRWGFWYKGGPVGWRTEPVDEQEVLGVLLYRAGQITKEQLDQSLDIMEEAGKRQGEALVDMGVFTFAQLVLLLQKQCEFVLQRVLRETEGAWSFHVLEALPETYINPPLRVPALLYKALRGHAKDMAAEDLANSLRPMLDQYVFLADGAAAAVTEMKLPPADNQFIGILASTSYRLRELFSVSNLPRSQTAAVTWVLADLSLIEFRAEEARQRVTDRNVRELASRKQAMTGSFFERLDLHWICTTSEVEAAYQKLAAEFAPSSVARFGDASRPTIQYISDCLKEAYDVLKTDASRREYRLKVIEKGKIEQSAEMLSKKGEMAVMKALAQEALECYVKANELVPHVAEYREGLQRARMMPRG